jgi:hypothetical protein
MAVTRRIVVHRIGQQPTEAVWKRFRRWPARSIDGESSLDTERRLQPTMAS